MSINRWILNDIDKEKIKKIAIECNVPFVCAGILYSRGIKSKKQVRDFFNSQVDAVNPLEIVDMEKAVLRVKSSIDNNEKICIYGDYDVDGITASAIVYSYLKKIGANVSYYIPSRENDGYGLNKKAIDNLKKNGTNLIFTVDNGVSAGEEIEYAKLQGIDVVVTDHHRVPEKLPDACAVVDLYRLDCDVKYKNFAGVGVAFKFLEAFDGGKSNIDEYLDLVTLGTIGDSIEMTCESKSMVQRGIDMMKNGNRLGVNALIEASGISKNNFNSISVAFCLVPRINAAGRMGEADLALKLLISDEKLEAQYYAEKLNDLNIVRRETEKKILSSVDELFFREPERLNQKIIIVEGKNWHKGVLGIVASRLVGKYGKPVILISDDGENAVASSRSVEGFSIHEAISKCSKWVERFGGHPMAAGINLKSKNINKFKEAILQVCDNYEMPVSELKVDLSLNPEKVSLKILEDIKLLNPFGIGNPEPVFSLMSMTLKKIIPLGGGEHTKIILERNNTEFTVLDFNKKTVDYLYEEGDKVDVALTFSKNEFRGCVSLSSKVIDIKLSGLNMENCISGFQTYDKFKRKEKLSSEDIALIEPSRNDFVFVYKYFRKNQNKTFRADILSFKIFGNSESVAKVQFIVDTLEKEKLITLSRKGIEFSVTINFCNKKIDLKEASNMYFLNELKSDQ